MNMNRPHCIVVLVALISAAATAFAETQSLDESFSMKGGATYAVHIRQQQPTQLSDPSFKQYGYWGAEGAQSSFCISSFVVERRAAKVRVPGKVFSDLCNANSLQLSERNGLFVLALQGGDAGDSFSAEYIFRGVYLIERIVRHGEFPEAYERTLFRYNTYEK